MISVDWVRHTEDGHARDVAWLTHVRLRLDADLNSMTLDTLVVENDQTESMSKCALMCGASSEWLPVKIFTTPAGMSDVSNTW